jgi:GNAT superfamily N-acetyltransferase
MTSPNILALFDAGDIARHIEGLTDLIHACIHDGASIGFIIPHSRAESEAFWRNKVLPAVRDGERLLLVAWRQGRIAGSVQLDYADFRRQGIARELMAEIERHAVALKRSLLTLDTRTGDSAEPLYRSLGYQTTGIIPGYCRDTLTERLDATTIMYKNL